ncbi:polysaccharide deacetylase family protein [Desulfothermobacter acidiphilus]|uniref:polysaccharide deacetylase family protein n=1 Tax=Desulfothermobacter acidiphilus TaxID=1938353 RepID=UPI003F89DAEE
MLPGDTLRHSNFQPQEAQDQPIYRAAGKGGKRVALTFDDGPYPGLTEQYLAVLEAHQATATFFVIGCRAERYPHLVRDMSSKGHEVGSHSWQHACLSKVNSLGAKEDLLRTARTLESITGKPVRYFRPPYGALGPGVMEAARELDESVVLWNVDPRDWTNPGPQAIIQRVLAQVRDGSIILLHEGRPGTLQALPILIRELRQQGYELVTLSELLSSSEKPSAAASPPQKEKGYRPPSVKETTYQPPSVSRTTYSPPQAGAGDKAPPAEQFPAPLPPKR